MIQKYISKIRDINIKGSGIISYYSSRIFISKPKGALIVNTIYNFKLKIDPVKDNGVEQSIYYYGTYEKGTLAIIDKILNKGDIFVDVGANIGLMSIFASEKLKQEGKVISFEPNPKTRAILEENIKLNNIKNIKVESFALSDTIKQGRIYDRWDINRGGASLIEPKIKTNSYDINETTFTNYFNTFERIKLIKIDVEGYELNVLKGAYEYISNAKYPPSLIVEFSSDRNNTFGKETTPLLSYLKEFNIYRFFNAVRGKERVSKLIEIIEDKEIPQHDNVFCFTQEQLDKLPKKLFK